MLSNNWIDGDEPLSDDIDEINEDDFGDEDNEDTESEPDFDDDIDDEILFNEKVRQRMARKKKSKRKKAHFEELTYDPPISRPVSPRSGKKKPVNKMEKIIGAIYKLSMYQVILVSNANPDSSTFYCKRWGIARDVSGFINRLLFGGIYTMRMKEWLKRFDSDHLFYRESSELFDHPIKLMGELEKFLGVTPFGDAKWANITTKVYNVKLEKGKGNKATGSYIFICIYVISYIYTDFVYFCVVKDMGMLFKMQEILNIGTLRLIKKQRFRIQQKTENGKV